jgi:hypothetical protein
MGYEFTTSQNQVFDEVALWMRIVAVGAAVDGILMLVNTLNSGAYNGLADTGVRAAVAVFLFLGSHAFKKIVDTRGDDMEHAMDALRSLRGYFFIQAAVLLITIGSVLYVVTQI